MKIRTVAAALVGASLVVGASGLATAASDPAPKQATIKQKGGFEFKPNRYIKEKLRWDRDVYRVRSGGTLRLVSNVNDSGPHTYTIIKKSDMPDSFDCKVCEELTKAHGANPESDEPPTAPFLDNGSASETLPKIDRPGDSVFVAPNGRATVDVTAAKGKTLHLVCLVHPWMQAKIRVG